MDTEITSNTVDNPYQDIPFLPFENISGESQGGAQFFSNVKQLQVGFGASVFRVDQDGMWAGAEDFASAPWKVDWEGNMTATSITIAGYVATGGSLSDIGVGNITGTYIANGAIVSDKIAANAVTAAKISVTQLSAISANIGDITAGTITGITITGGTLRTSATANTGVKIGPDYNGVSIYGQQLSFYDGSTLYGYVGTYSGYFNLNAVNRNIKIDPGSGYAIYIANGCDILPLSDGASALGSADYSWNSIYGGNMITNILRLNANAYSPTTGGQIRNYASGATDQFRGVPGDGTWVGSFDMTSV